jgi:hypothetical protein
MTSPSRVKTSSARTLGLKLLAIDRLKYVACRLACLEGAAMGVGCHPGLGARVIMAYLTGSRLRPYDKAELWQWHRAWRALRDADPDRKHAQAMCRIMELAPDEAYVT